MIPDARSLRRLATFASDDLPGAPDGITAIIDVARELLGLSTVLVARQAGGACSPTHVSGDRFGLPTGATLPLVDTFCQIVLDAAAPLSIGDVPRDPLGQGMVAGQQRGVRTYVGVPLVGRDGTVLGTVCGLDRRPNMLRPEHVANLQVLGRLVANELERAESLAALERSERTLTDFFEQAAMPLHWVGADGTILRANQAELDLLGHTRAEYVGHHIAEFHADGPVIDDILARLGANETLRDYEARLRHKDGSIRDVLIDSSVFWQDGAFVHSRCFTRDVTARKAAEAQLAALARQQAAVAEFGQRAVVETDLETLFQDAATTVAATLGVEYATVLELAPDGQTLLLRAGVGWPDELVGRQVVDAGVGSQAAYTIAMGAPVVLVDLLTETRFSPSPLMRQFSIVSGLSTVIHGRAQPHGVIGAHATTRRPFTDDDTQFLRSVANVLAAAIERRRAEEASRESRFRSLVENAADLISVASADGVMLYQSPAIHRLLGYAAADREGRDGFELVHPDDVAGVGDALARTVASPAEVITTTCRVRHRDGTYRHFELTLTNRLDDPSIAGIVINARDVTERQEADGRLRRSEARFRALVQEAVDIIVVADPAGRFTYVNPALMRILGHPVEAYAGGLRLDLVHPRDVAAVRRMLVSVLSSPGQHERVSYRTRHADGRWVWLEGTVANQIDNPAVGGLVVNMRDVTEREVAAEELGFQAALLDQATVAVIATDPAGIVTHWNRHAETLYGWSRGEAVGRDMSPLMIGPTDSAVSKAIMARLADGLSWEGEFTMRCKDGMEVPVHANNSPVFGAEGRLMGIVGVSVDISERKMFEARLAHQASYDALTGLPNRTLFTDRLEATLARVSRLHTPPAVLFLDLDGFKVVNDSLGHAAGDRLLVAVGQRLANGLRAEETLARFGGDEFTILLPNVSTVRGAVRVAERLLSLLETPFRLEGRDTHVAASIGIALGSPSLARPADLLQAADIALYQAKADGRGTYRIFEPGSIEPLTARMHLEADLRHAVGRGELRLYYQPEIDLTTGVIVGAEALVRWEHPRRGLLGAGDFIPIAEESGLILPLGAWVLEEACRQAGAWRELGTVGKRLTISVNLAARQLRQPGLVDQVRQATRRAGLPAGRLTLEITERTVVADAETETNVLGRIRQLGVKLAIDDFGTGYSSLGYLRRWPVDTLKIDRSFVAGIGDDAGGRQLVAAMADLAHALGANVIAEGIETAGQLALLREMGIERGQGYYFSPPVPADDFARLLTRDEPYAIGPDPAAGPSLVSDGRARTSKTSTRGGRSPRKAARSQTA